MSEVVLVVDDDPVQRRLLEAMVGRFGYRAKVAEGGDAALNILKGPDATRIDAIVLDLVMPDLDGLGVLAQMREIGLNMPVIVQTAQGGIDGVASAMRLGAADFVVKPANAERVQVSLRNVLATRALAGEVERLRLSLPSESMCTQPLIEPSPALAASWPEPDNHAVPVAPHSVPLVDPRGNIRPLEEIERDCHPFRHIVLPRAVVRSGSQAQNWPLNALSQAGRAGGRGRLIVLLRARSDRIAQRSRLLHCKIPQRRSRNAPFLAKFPGKFGPGRTGDWR
jgi:CheY-like chemotaxis protein